MAQRSGYIGRHPGDGNSAIVRQTYSLTSETTELSFTAGYIVGFVDVYLNGVKLIDAQDYEATNTSTIGLTTAAPSGDVIEVVAYKALNVGNVQKANNDFEVTNNTTLGGTVSVAGTSTLTGVVTTGGDLYVGGDLYGDGSNLSGVGNTEYIDAGSVTSSGIVTISNTTASTSTTTGALVISGGVGIAGSMFVGENVSIAGTLTYEDVTNIDSVGVVTAQLGVIATAGRGVQVTAGGLNVTAGIATFKNEVDADGGIDVAGGVKVGAALTVVGALDVDGATTLDTVTIAEELTNSGGVDITGGLKVAGISTFGGSDIQIAGSATGITSVTWDASANSLIFKDSSVASFGDDTDLQIYHQDSINYIKSTNASAPIQLQAPAGEVLGKFSPNGSVDLYHNGNKKFETSNDGTVTTGIATATSIDAAIGLWILGADGTSHYTFTGIGLTVTTDDPTLELQRGQTYIFRNQSGGHPFRIQSTVNGSAGTAYNHGVTNNDGGDGTDITFAVPYNAPNILYYQCTSHANMGGVLMIGERAIPARDETSQATLVADDAGKVISTTTGGWVVPTGVLEAGDAVTLLNKSGSGQTITCSAVTMYNSADGSTVTSRTLGARGVCTIWFESGSVAYISGAGLS